MYRMLSGVLFVGLFTALMAPITHARDGLYLGAGIGIQTSEFKTYYINQSLADTDSGLLSSVKIGAHVNRQFALYLQRETLYWSDDVNGVIVTGNLSGLGGAYYFEPVVGSAFLEFGLGYGNLNAPFEDDGKWFEGGAALIGLGAEVNKNLQVGVVLMQVLTADTDDQDLKFNTRSIGLKAEFKL